MDQAVVFHLIARLSEPAHENQVVHDAADEQQAADEKQPGAEVALLLVAFENVRRVELLEKLIDGEAEADERERRADRRHQRALGGHARALERHARTARSELGRD